MTNLPPQSSVTGNAIQGAGTEGAGTGTGPSLSDLTEALRQRAGSDGTVPAGIAAALVEETGWNGRLLDVLGILTDDVEKMGYLAGGRRPDEVVTSLSLWAESPLSLGDIRLIVTAGGWDPEPFVVLSRAGLLRAILQAPDGSIRRIRGELAGGWVSDQLALADDTSILRAVREVLDGAGE
ncbi:MAG: hypothetical protein M0T79_06495 [Actinomycetota bacterium]|nr:hypothetical protein [Actinomycetota bacterium]